MFRQFNISHQLNMVEHIAGIGSWRVDLEKNRLYWSKKIFDIHGVSPDEYTPELNSALNFYHPEDAPVVQKVLDKAIKEKENFQFELRILRADGTTRWVRSKGECELNALGDVVAVNGVFQDITTDKEIRDRLKKSEERFSLAIKGAKSGVWDWLDVNENKEWWSPQFYHLLGYEDEEITASLDNFASALHPDDSERTFNLVKKHFAGEADFDLEYRLKTKSGDYRWFHGKGAVSRDKEGNPKRMVGSITDIHDRKQQEQLIHKYNNELQRRNKELDSFAYSTSHDLKAPLRAIDNLSTWILEDAYDHLPPESKKHLEQLRKRVERLERLLDDLLQYSRADHIDSTLEHVEPRKLLLDIFDSLAVPSSFSIDIPDDFPTLFTHRTPLYKVFSNLITNALKHHHLEDGIIQIRWRKEGEMIVFSITDNGPGIDPAYHERIFDIFQTLKPRDEVEGSGMGLAIVQKLVQRVGGKISVHSTTGEGSTFTFSWPTDYADVVELVEF